MLSLFPEFLTYEQLAPLMLRLILAVILFGNGYVAVKAKSANFWTKSIGIVEIVSSVMLFIGFLTQLAVLFVVGMSVMFILMKIKTKQKFLGGYDFDVLIMVCALSLFVLGPGVFSIDIPL